MKVREAGPDDAQALATLHESCFDRPWKAWEIRRVLLTGGTWALAIDGLDSLWGFAVARVIASDAEILTLAVDPTRRRRGIGRSLTQAAAARALTTGADRLLLEVAVDNPAGLALYRRQGFQPVGVRKNYYARPGATRVDAQVLELPLNTGRR